MSNGRYRAYPEYKDSGIDWLGQTPQHWELSPLKHLAQFSGGGTPNKDTAAFWNGNIPWVSPKDMKGRFVDSTIDNVTPRAIQQSSTNLVAEGALLLVVRSGILQHSIPAAINRVPVTLNQDMKALRFGPKMTAHFAQYFVKGNQRPLLLEWCKQGATVESIEQELLGSSHVPVPPLEEQTQIAAFLDHETAKIDRLIEKQEALIRLLKEKRQAVISHAVTKGLNPHAPLKDSGIEWLGQVPEHWEAGKTKYFAQLKTGHTPSRSTPEYWENCYIPWISLADVWQIRDPRNIYITETNEKISELGLANSAAELLPKGTVIVSRTASVGFSGIMSTAMATTQDFVNWIPGPKLTSEYLLYVFRAMEQVFDALKVGSTHKTIYMPDVHNFTTPVPPVSEQREIVEFIKHKTQAFDRAGNAAQEAVTLLQERRTALISAAVTGKIDVRHWQPPGEENT